MKSKRGQDQRGQQLWDLKVKAEPLTPLGCLFLALSLINTRGSRARFEGSAEGKRVLSTWRGKAGLCEVWGSRWQAPWWEMWSKQNRMVTPNGSILPGPGCLRASVTLENNVFSLHHFSVAFLLVFYQTSLLVQEAALQIVCYFTLSFPVYISVGIPDRPNKIMAPNSQHIKRWGAEPRCWRGGIRPLISEILIFS